MVQEKPHIRLQYQPLEKAQRDPGEFLLSDFSKIDRSNLIHVAFLALDAFVQKKGSYPASGDGKEKDATEFVQIAKVPSLLVFSLEET